MSREPMTRRMTRFGVRTATAAGLFAAMATGAAGLAAVAGQQPGFRPSNLGDMVKAVGVSRVGLEDDVDLSRVVAEHALFIGDEVGIAARLRDDPQGAIFIAWRTPGEPWRFTFASEADFPPLAPDAGPVERGATRLGYLKTIAPMGPHIVIETHPIPDRPSSVVLRRDLSPLAQVDGRVVLALPSGVLIVERGRHDGPASVEALFVVDPGSRRADPLYPPPAAPSGAPAAAIAPRSIRVPVFDPAADALTFVVEPGPGVQPRTVTCRPMSSATPVCG